MSISPRYTISYFNDDLYKVVKFKGNRDPDVYVLRQHSEQQVNEAKLSSNFSRARSLVLQYALCNPWQYFVTLTLDQRRFNRYSLDPFASRLSQFVRDKRKAYGTSLQVLLVPEHHKDGAWHMHGLVNGLPDDRVRPFRWPEPKVLIDGGFLNWPDYQSRFGFCSLAPIRDPVATAYYVSKYVSKDLSRRGGDLGKHLYFHSRPLRKAEPISDVYTSQPELDACLTHDYDFVRTGMVSNVPWYWPFMWDTAEFRNQLPDPEPVRDPLSGFNPREIDPFYEQLSLEEF